MAICVVGCTLAGLKSAVWMMAKPAATSVYGMCDVTGGEDTEEVLGWASGAKYDLKKPALFGV